MKPICTFSDGTRLYFDRGAFDDWCVFLEAPGAKRYAPSDQDYFSRLNELGNLHGHLVIYNDFVSVYDRSTANIDATVIDSLPALTQKYAEHALEMEKLFAILYAGMVAEENKQHAILKKRIKRLGMHQTLVLRLNPVVAANFSRGKKWKELDELCRQLGF